MIQYYGHVLSPNQLETGEGFLICKNVPIARIGQQEYLGSELGLSGDRAAAVINVQRPEVEVFSKETLASFEGKPVTNDHPPELLTPDNAAQYTKGHAERVHRGAEEWTDYILADLHVHDRELIDAIKSGKREVSCGYECDYIENKDGTFEQQNIRGNHIAVVERGRAGKKAAIMDSHKEAPKTAERKKMSKNGFFMKLFGQAVKDKSPEEIAQLAEDAAAVMDEEPAAAEGGEETTEKPTGESGTDEAMIDAIVDKVVERLAAKQTEKAKDPIDEAIEQLTGEGATEDENVTKVTSEEEKVVPANEEKPAGSMDHAMAEILKAVRPAVAGIKDEAQRKAVTDALIGCISAGNGKESDITKIMQTAKKNAQRVADSSAADSNEAMQKSYDALNPHKRKETK